MTFSYILQNKKTWVILTYLIRARKKLNIDVGDKLEIRQ
jgi:hypothetical protein